MRMEELRVTPLEEWGVTTYLLPLPRPAGWPRGHRAHDRGVQVLREKYGFDKDQVKEWIDLTTARAQKNRQEAQS